MSDVVRRKWRRGGAALALLCAVIVGCASLSADREPAGQASGPEEEETAVELPRLAAEAPESAEPEAAEAGAMGMRREEAAEQAAADPRRATASGESPVTSAAIDSLLQVSSDQGGARYGIAGPSGGGLGARPPARALPQSGVLANNFVGGAGVEARLGDLLDRGVPVGAEQVRVEAFQDRGRLPYAVPSEEAVALYAELERTKVRASGDSVHLQIALLAKQGEAPPRPRLDVRLVLDRSGSMREQGKWQHAVAAAHALVDRLEPGDTFGLVSYSDTASLDVAPTRVGDARAVHRAIDRMRPGGGTNIEAALALARGHRPVRTSPTDVGLVVLLSDGMATVGVTDPRTLAETAREMFDESGVLTTTIGVGTSFDEETMLAVAREGSGSYHFVRRPADVQSILEDELEERVQAVAQALRVRVVLGPGVVARRVYGSRLLGEREHAAVRRTEVATDERIARELGVARDRRTEEEEGLRIHLPTFRRGDQHVILMELDVPGGRAGGTAGIARVHLDYKDLVRRDNGAAEAAVTAARVADPEEAMESVERTVKRTVLAFQAGEALGRAASALGAEDAREAMRLLRERRELLEAAAELWRDPSLRRDARLLGQYETVVAQGWPGLRSADRRTLVMAMSYFGDQRMR